MKRKSHLKWSWIFLVMFIILSVINVKFGLLGLICMSVPLYHALRGRGKIHCSHYCPRGSFLGNFLKYINLDYNLPKSMQGKTAKKIILALMLTVFSISLYHAGLNPNKIAFAIFRLMTASLAVGVIMGIIFKPRTWCKVCPMGYATELITKGKKKNSKSLLQ